MVNAATQLLLKREDYAYTTLWESLAVNQRKFLKGLASEAGKVQPFSAEFIGTYGLGSASNVQRVVDSLSERERHRQGQWLVLNQRPIFQALGAKCSTPVIALEIRKMRYA